MSDGKWGTIWYIESRKFTDEDAATLSRWHEMEVAHNLSKHEVPFPADGRLVVPVIIDYEAAIREWEYYEQDVDPYENRTYEQMIRDVVDAAIGEEEQ